MTRLIDPINSVGMKGAMKHAVDEHQSMMTRLLVATDHHLQPLITEEMVEAGARAIAPEVWAIDPATFGHPDSLNRRGHELCKSKVRAQAAACLEAALRQGALK